MKEPGKTLPLALGALGVVFGDIGTSPLYAVKACFNEFPRVQPTPENVLGVISLIFWSLILVISLKYASYVMRADNRGEGGIFSLLALLLENRILRRGSALAAFGVFGAALLYADGVITPAISVLSAVEGISVVTKAASPYVVPIACGILLGLFLMQRKGTGVIGKYMGPVMVVWFLSLAVLGASSIFSHPEVLWAVNPLHAAAFMANGGLKAFMVLGSVVLCVTGGEALYADMGHFGAGPIRMSWYGLALPSLLCVYFGQGALLLRNPAMAESPFFSLVPANLMIPMVILAAMATVIASQAVISGVFSLTRQASQLGYLPRVRIRHTSEDMEGQIYIPGVNFIMMLACLGLTIHFGSSSRLAGAYGIAVTGTMFITTGLFYLVARRIWGWNFFRAAVPVAIFMFVDLAFFGANLFKIISGGWIPLVTAVAIALIMRVWRTGREALLASINKDRPSLASFFSELDKDATHRVPGAAVFLSASLEYAPLSLVNLMKRFKIIPQTAVVLTVVVEDIPRVAPPDRLMIKALTPGAYHVIGRYGFMESPNVALLLRQAESLDPRIRSSDVTYVLGREVPYAATSSPLGRLSRALFVFMLNQAASPADYYAIPPGDMVDMGVRAPV
jgi:KUP system potassium uptake protein